LAQMGSTIAENRGNQAVLKVLYKAKDGLMSAVDDVKDPATGEIASTQIDPKHLYNVRKDIGYSLSSKAQGTTDDASAAASQLYPLMGTIDDTIEPGAPGFKITCSNIANCRGQ
jgi:hypothetical protein